MATKNLIVRVGADLSDLEKATDKVKGHFAKLEQVRKSEAANRQDSLTQELDQASQKVQELKKQYRELVGGMGQAKNESGLLKQLRETEKARAELDKEYANKDGSLKNNIPESVMLQYDALAKRSDELYAKVKQIRLNPAATPEAQALARQLQEAYKNAADLQKELNSANGDAAAVGVGKGTSLKARALDGLAAAGNGAKTVLGGIGSAAAKGLGLLGQGAKTGASALGNFLGKQANNVLNGVKSLGSGIANVAKRIASLAASALVFNVLSQGFRTVQQGIAGMVESDSQLKASLAGIQGNLLAAFAPLWQTILPMVRAVTAALASLAGMIAQVMAALFGTSTSAAQKSAAAYSKQASAATGSAGATKKAAEEAKKAQREAMDFDILHKVNDNSGTDSSGGGGSGGVSPDFGTTIKATPFVDQLVQAIKDDDWYKVGAMFAEKLNEAMENIPWEKIRNTAHKWALNIAEPLNGFVETLDWGLVGNTLGNGLNTALDFLDTFAQNFHWDSLGQGIGNGLEGMRQSIDWEQLGRFMTDKLKAVFETLHGFVTSGFNWRALGDDVATAINSAWNNIDWVQAAIDIGELIKGILSGASSAIEGTNWSQIGSDCAEAVKAVDWNGIMDGLFEFIGAVAGAVFAGFGSFFTGLFDGLGDTMHEYFGDIGDMTIEGFFEGMQKLLEDIGGWIKEHIVDPFVKGFKDALGIHSPSTVMKDLGGYTTQGFLDGISGKWDDVTSWVGEHLTGLVDKFKNWKEQTGQTVSEWAEGTGQTVQNWIGDTAANVGSWVTDRKADFETWASNTSQTVSGWAGTAKQTFDDWGSNAKSSVTDFSTNARSTFDQYSTMTQQTLSTWKTLAVAVFSRFGENAKTTMQGAIDGITGTIAPMVSDALNWGGDFIQNFIDGIKGKMTGLLDSVKDMAQQVRSYLHFSVPDTGPLADADRWMPDFMTLMAEGVEKNTPALLARVQNAARQIDRAYNQMNAPALAVAGGMTVTADPMQRMDSGTDDMIATLRSGFNAVCKAVQDKDSSVYLDGDKVEDKTAKSRRKMARLYGRDE